MFGRRLREWLIPARLGEGFGWLLGSSWSSNLADGMAIAAGPLLVASLTAQPFVVAIAAMLAWAPHLLFALHAGVLSDRRDRRRILLAANLARALALVVVVSLVLTERAEVWMVLVALGALATAEVFADNAAMTLTPMLVARDDLLVANARIQAGFITLNQLAGPPLGAALFAVGHAWPFAGQALLLLAAAAQVGKLRLPAREDAGGPDRRSVLRELVEGLRWVRAHDAIRTLALTILMFNITFGAAWSVLVLYARDRIGLGEIGFGVLTSVSAAGGLLGTALYGPLTRRVSLGAIMRVGLIIETLTHLGLALTRSAWVASAIFFVFGAHAFIWGTTSITVRQRAVPEQLQGRVGGVNTWCVFGGLVVGAGVGGVLATRYGVTAPFWFAFAGSALFVILLWRQLRLIAHAD